MGCGSSSDDSVNSRSRNKKQSGRSRGGERTLCAIDEAFNLEAYRSLLVDFDAMSVHQELTPIEDQIEAARLIPVISHMSNGLFNSSGCISPTALTTPPASRSSSNNNLNLLPAPPMVQQSNNLTTADFSVTSAPSFGGNSSIGGGAASGSATSGPVISNDKLNLFTHNTGLPPPYHIRPRSILKKEPSSSSEPPGEDEGSSLLLQKEGSSFDLLSTRHSSDVRSRSTTDGPLGPSGGGGFLDSQQSMDSSGEFGNPNHPATTPPIAAPMITVSGGGGESSRGSVHDSTTTPTHSTFESRDSPGGCDSSGTTPPLVDTTTSSGTGMSTASQLLINSAQTESLPGAIPDADRPPGMLPGISGVTPMQPQLLAQPAGSPRAVYLLQLQANQAATGHPRTESQSPPPPLAQFIPSLTGAPPADQQLGASNTNSSVLSVNHLQVGNGSLSTSMTCIPTPPAHPRGETTPLGDFIAPPLPVPMNMNDSTHSSNLGGSTNSNLESSGNATSSWNHSFTGSVQARFNQSLTPGEGILTPSSQSMSISSTGSRGNLRTAQQKVKKVKYNRHIHTIMFYNSDVVGTKPLKYSASSLSPTALQQGPNSPNSLLTPPTGQFMNNSSRNNSIRGNHTNNSSSSSLAGSSSHSPRSNPSSPLLQAAGGSGRDVRSPSSPTSAQGQTALLRKMMSRAAGNNSTSSSQAERYRSSGGSPRSTLPPGSSGCGTFGPSPPGVPNSPPPQRTTTVHTHPTGMPAVVAMLDPNDGMESGDVFTSTQEGPGNPTAPTPPPCGPLVGGNKSSAYSRFTQGVDYGTGSGGSGKTSSADSTQAESPISQSISQPVHVGETQRPVPGLGPTGLVDLVDPFEGESFDVEEQSEVSSSAK